MCKSRGSFISVSMLSTRGARRHLDRHLDALADLETGWADAANGRTCLSAVGHRPDRPPCTRAGTHVHIIPARAPVPGSPHVDRSGRSVDLGHGLPHLGLTWYQPE
ncbi:hypothetical protein FRAHR75_610040 [Frankia sp. Hr75.2]|nr:hypothetical protein FRAHR75_610040 [Frankia sp. Hr75.2]